MALLRDDMPPKGEGAFHRNRRDWMRSEKSQPPCAGRGEERERERKRENETDERERENERNAE